MVTSQHHMTSRCMCPSDTISPSLSLPGHHSHTCQGRGQVGGILHSASSVPEGLWCPRNARAPSSPDPAMPLLWPKPQALVPLLWAQRCAPHTLHTGPGPCVHPTMDAPNRLPACSSHAEMVPVPSHAGQLSTGPGTLGLSQQQLMQYGDKQSPYLQAQSEGTSGPWGGLSRGASQPAPSCTGGGAERPLQPHTDQMGMSPKRRAAPSPPLPITTPTSP